MPKLGMLRAEKLIKVAKKLGFIHVATHGSHYIMRRPSDGRHLSIPIHKGRDLGRGITKSIIADMDLSVDEFLKLF